MEDTTETLTPQENIDQELLSTHQDIIKFIFEIYNSIDQSEEIDTENRLTIFGYLLNPSQKSKVLLSNQIPDGHNSNFTIVFGSDNIDPTYFIDPGYKQILKCNIRLPQSEQDNSLITLKFFQSTKLIPRKKFDHLNFTTVSFYSLNLLRCVRHMDPEVVSEKSFSDTSSLDGVITNGISQDEIDISKQEALTGYKNLLGILNEIIQNKYTLLITKTNKSTNASTQISLVIPDNSPKLQEQV